ncbi:MAG: zf-HC2 domain-containing protein [Planctomycetes bacterium]|nr:zf-HC2 domain-containing protein [Planctomycetota bacterium]
MACPGLEVLAKMAEGKLPAAERERVLEHLADCDACRQAAVVLAGTDRTTTRHISRPTNGFPWAAAVTIAASLVVGILAWRTFGGAPPEPRTPREKPAEEGVAGTREIPKTDPKPLPDPVRPEPPKPEPPKPEPPPPQPDPPGPVGPKDPPPPQPEAPQPEPLKPEPTKPEPDPVKPAPGRPRRPDPAVLASVRLLDVNGDVTASKQRIASGASVHDTITTSTGAAFRVNGDLVAMKKGTVAILGRENDATCLFVEAGEAYVESSGARWRFADEPLALTGAVIVTPTAVALASELEPKDAARRLAPFNALRPRQRTWLLEDYASKPAGFETGEAEGPVVAAWISLDRPAPWSRNLTVRLRVRTNAPAVQVGMRLEKRDTADPWTSIVSVRKGAWTALTVTGKQFNAGPTGAKEPAAGEGIVELGFSIDPALVGGKDAPLLEIDDVSLIEAEIQGERR